jgi:hypothetical protein
MALDVGTLVAHVELDDSEFEEGLDRTESSFSSFGESLAGLAAAVGAGAAIALVGAMVVNADDIGHRIAANFGETPAEAGKYGEIAGQIYSDNFGESLADISEAMMAVRKQGLIEPGADAEELKRVTEQAMTLSEVLGQDVTGAARAASQMVRTGIAKDSTEAFDLLAWGIQNGIDKSEDLVDTFNEYPTMFREIGVSAPQAMGMMSQALKAGARDSDTVADALKEFAIRSKDMSTTSMQAYKDLGLNGQKMTAIFAKGGPEAAQGLATVIDKLKAIQDPAERNAAAVALFGTKAEDLGQALYAIDPTTATQQLEGFQGATQRAADTAGQSAAAKLETFKKKVETAVIETLGGVAVPVLTTVIDKLQSLGSWVQQNSAWLAPLGIVIGSVAAAFLIATAATSAWAAAQAVWNAIMAANPIILIIGLVIGLIAAIIYLWNTNETFRNFFIAIWNGIWGFLKGVGAWFAGPFANFFVSAWHVITGVAEWAWNKMKGFFSGLGSFVGGIFDGAKGAAIASINGMIGVINGAIGGLNRMIDTANNIPGVSIPHIGKLPRLARGGVVKPSPGGTPVIMGDGGQVEYGLPESDLEALLRRAAGGGPGMGGVLTVIIKGTGLLRGIRSTARIEGGDSNTVLVGA